LNPIEVDEDTLILSARKGYKGGIIVDTVVELQVATDVFLFDQEVTEQLIGDVNMLELVDL
jgi:hypothetical protein